MEKPRSHKQEGDFPKKHFGNQPQHSETCELWGFPKQQPAASNNKQQSTPVHDGRAKTWAGTKSETWKISDQTKSTRSGSKGTCSLDSCFQCLPSSLDPQLSCHTPSASVGWVLWILVLSSSLEPFRGFGPPWPEYCAVCQLLFSASQ